MTELQIVNETNAIVEVGNSFSENLVADWLAFNADKAEATVRTYSKAIGNFFGWLADNGIKKPRREDVIRYRDELCSSKKISTARLYTTAVKVFSKWLASKELYRDFAAGVGTPKLDEKSETHSREALTLSEAKAVLNSFKGKTNVKSLRDALILRIMLNCGLRSIEIVRLDAADIEKRHGKIFLRVWGKGRSGKTARVEISKTVYEMILDYLNARGSKRAKGEPMFVSTANRNRGQRLQTQTVSRLAKATFRAIGVDSPTITCHSCRHFAATQLLKSGCDIARVQRLLRHKNSATTEIYRHDIQEATDNTVQTLSDILDCA